MPRSERRQQGTGDGHEREPRTRRLRNLARYLLGPVMGFGVLTGGTDKNSLGPNPAMAQITVKRPAKRKAQPEEIPVLEKMATRAAAAYKSYILTGNEAQYKTFKNIYEGKFPKKGGQDVTDYTEFNDKFDEAMEDVEKDPVVAKLIGAYNRFIGVFGVFHKKDFIEHVHKTYGALQNNAVSWDRVAQYIKSAKEETPPRILTEDNARKELEGPALPIIRSQYGEELTKWLEFRMPYQQAKLAIGALKDFILTGDKRKEATYKQIFRTYGTTQPFFDDFKREFRRRIVGDKKLEPIIKAYKAKHKNVKALEFANAVSAIHSAATAGDARTLNELRGKHGGAAVDYFVRIIARELAKKCADLMARALQGDRKARDDLVTLYTGSFVQLVKPRKDEILELVKLEEEGKYIKVKLEHHSSFKREFERQFLERIKGNEMLVSRVKTFRRNILSIAIRDISTELAKEDPKRARVEPYYGRELVDAVETAMETGELTWMVREPDELADVIDQRALAGDTYAAEIAKLKKKKADRGTALGETYAHLVRERMKLRTIKGADLIWANFDKLDWVKDKSPKEIQEELERRAGVTVKGRRRPGEVKKERLAVELRAVLGENAGQKLMDAYDKIRDMKSEREDKLEDKHGKEFVEYVAKNLDLFHWVVKPVEQIEAGMRSRIASDFVIQMHKAEKGRYAVGYSPGTLAHALHDIHNKLKVAGADEVEGIRKSLVDIYGQPAVDFVEKNRGKLAWLTYSEEGIGRFIENNIDVEDAVMRTLKRMLFAYPPMRFVKANADAAIASETGGIAIMNVNDSLGATFLTAAAPPAMAERAVTEPITDIQQAKSALVSRARRLRSELDNLRAAIGDSYLSSARVVLEELIGRWERENSRIEISAKTTMDGDTLALLKQEQRRLWNAILKEGEMNKSIQFAFAVIHIAETGGGIRMLAPSARPLGEYENVAEEQSLARLITWYNGIKDPDKKTAVEEIVISVLKSVEERAQELKAAGKVDRVIDLYSFIRGMEDRDFFERLAEVYTRLRGGQQPAELGQKYGDVFVSAVFQHFKVLGLLKGGATMSDLETRRKNELYASVTIRVYRAIVSPKEGEDRAAMVKLYGKHFVAAVEKHAAELSSLKEPGAALKDIKQLPPDVRKSLWKAYASAHEKLVSSLRRAYRNQDDELLHALKPIYDAIEKPEKDAEAQELRMSRLRREYGKRLVDAVEKYRDRLKVLGKTDDPLELKEGYKEIDEGLREYLHRQFEKGPRTFKKNVMTRFIRLADRLPFIYRRMMAALRLENAMEVQVRGGTEDRAETLGEDLLRAIQLYREEFGEDDYLLKKFMNFDLFNDSITKLENEYQIIIPEVKKPEDLANFLSTPLGVELINKGRNFYLKLEEGRLAERDALELEPGDRDADLRFTEADITGLRSKLSIIDILYLGAAVHNASSTKSVFGRAAARATMDSLLVIGNKDPYLVGPFIMYVLPALIDSAADEKVLVASLTGFNALFSTNYPSVGKGLGYNLLIRREFFHRWFKEIEKGLAEKKTAFDLDALQGKRRAVNEPLTGEEHRHPRLYQSKPEDLHLAGFAPLPQLLALGGEPIDTLPQPFVAAARMPVPGGLPVTSGAVPLDTKLARQIYMHYPRALKGGVPQRFKVGSMLGAAAIIRELTKLLGSLPYEFSDRWVSGDIELGGFALVRGEYDEEEEETTTTTTGWGVRGTGFGRTVSGVASGEITAMGEETVTKPPSVVEEAPEEEAPPEGEEAPPEEEAAAAEAAKPEVVSEVRVDIDTQAATIRYGLGGLVPILVANAADADMSGTGLVTGETVFHHEELTREVEGAPAETERLETSGFFKEFYKLQKEKGDHVFIMVGGKSVPELTNNQGDVTQSERKDLRTRIYWIDADTGRIHQAAYGFNTHVQILNYLYGGPINSEDLLAGFRFMGRDMAPTFKYTDAEIRSRLATVEGKSRAKRLLMGKGFSEEDADKLLKNPATLKTKLEEFGLLDKAVPGKTVAAGFDGMAVGFTVPREKAVNFSFLGFGGIAKNISDAEPSYVHYDLSTALRSLQTGEYVDHVGLFYRGAHNITVSEDDPTYVTDSELAEATGEIMWRRISFPIGTWSWEARGVLGWPEAPGTEGAPRIVGGQIKLQKSVDRFTSYGLGATGAAADIEVFRGAPEVNMVKTYATEQDETQEIYTRTKNILIHGYGWEEDEAANLGWLVSGSYLYSKLEGWTGAEGTEKEAPMSHGYLSVLMMAWAKRHGLIGGFQRVPGYTQVYDRIGDAMERIQLYPERQDQILEQLANELRSDMTRDIYRFALGWGYDGEKNQLYFISSGQWTGDDRAYGDLYGVFLFDKPTKWFVDVLGHAHLRTVSTVIEDPSVKGHYVVRTKQVPNVDAYLGWGFTDEIGGITSRFEMDVKVAQKIEHGDALRFAYKYLTVDNIRGRLERVFGKKFADTMHKEKGKELEWMVKSRTQVLREIMKRRDEGDPLVEHLMQNVKDEREAAKLLHDLYIEIRRKGTSEIELRDKYKPILVDFVKIYVDELDWMLLSPEQVRKEFSRRGRDTKSLAGRVAMMALKEPPVKDKLTGEEVQRLVEHNLPDVLAAMRYAERTEGLMMGKYDVILGSSLQKDMGKLEKEKYRSDTYYLMLSKATTSPDSVGSIMIGNRTDLDSWMADDKGLAIGRGISRLEIEIEDGEYKFVISGDRKDSYLSAARIVGGVSIPLNEEELDRYRIGENWTLGGVINLFQNESWRILGGAVVGKRRYGDQVLTQINATLSARLQKISTEDMLNQWTGYVFFNRVTSQVVLASKDVFGNAAEDRAEMAGVCAALSEGKCTTLGDLRREFERTTAGVGITWARADIITGEDFHLDLFFEGGVERRRDLEKIEPMSADERVTMTVPEAYRVGLGRAEEAWTSYFVGRAGVSVGQTFDKSVLDVLPGARWQFQLGFYRGNFVPAPGVITHTQQFGPWERAVSSASKIPFGVWADLMINF